MADSNQPTELSPEAEQKIQLLTAALKKTVEIFEADLRDLEAILEEMECDVEDQDLPYSQKLKACSHCCLIAEEKRKKDHLNFIENCFTNLYNK